MMGKPKQLTWLPKKQKAKAALPETVEDFQTAADIEEDAGGKWRKGDVAKSGRAFVRALEVYNKGLEQHPDSFDLAYNKARLELEITQQPSLISHIGLPLEQLFRETLASHRYALRLNEGDADVLFNTAQVLTSLAEHLAEARKASDAISLLHEALELLSACLSRQEMLFEQQRMAFDDMEDGGVNLGPEEKPDSNAGSDLSDQTVTIQSPITPGDLLDTIHASVSALTTLVSLVEPSALQTLGDMAQSLTESKSPSYVLQLSEDVQDNARLDLLISRAVFTAAFADAQYNALMIDIETYGSRLQAFDIPNNKQSFNGLCSEAEARTELAMSVMARFDDSVDLPASTCWKQLTVAQELYTQATEAFGNAAQTYLSRGDIEMARHRLVIMSQAQVPKTQRKSAPTLARNAQTYYKNAVHVAESEESELKRKANLRMLIAALLRRTMYGIDTEPEGISAATRDPGMKSSLISTLEDCVDEGLLDGDLTTRMIEILTAGT